MAGIGLMSDGETVEDFRGAAIPEPIAIINNTICRNQIGLVGGGQLQVLNNLFVENLEAPLKNVKGSVRLTHNLFWANGAEPEDSELDSGVVLKDDPRLDREYRFDSSSVCVDRGTTHIDLEQPQRAVNPDKFSRSGTRPGGV